MLHPFGRSGLDVSRLCLGTMTFGVQADETDSFAILDRAWDQGVRFIDTADVYPVPMTYETYGVTEAIIGRWLKRRGTRRDAVIASKGYFPSGPASWQRGNSRRHLLEACEGSLRRLGVERIDLYLCHGWDPDVPIDETLGALEELRLAGKIFKAGISNLRAHELAECHLAAARAGIEGFVAVQTRHNILYREAEESLLPMTQRFGVGVMVYNPLAGGLLSGKYRPGADPTGGRFTLGDTGATYRKRYWNDANLSAAARVAELTRAAGFEPVTASVAWSLARGDLDAIIIGASRPDQLDASLSATRLTLPDDLKDALDQIWFDLPRQPPTLDTPRLAPLPV